ncbi:MAG TPA: hypothetical protein VGS17_10205 [Candidatus Limnocylindria bacterium]|nr:hypothetical protein [Candidatus Limnocylindria bacterium]HEV2055163.1 hypothetical protein [Methylomirabilota bacterium]
MLKSPLAAILATGLLLTAGAGTSLANDPLPNPNAVTVPADEQCGAEGEQLGNQEDTAACNTDQAQQDKAGPDEKGDTQTGEKGESGATGATGATGASGATDATGASGATGELQGDN